MLLVAMTVSVLGLLHIGIRVRDRPRALAFYRVLGFEEKAWYEGPRVAVLTHPSGLELNLIVNAVGDDGAPNVLMDVPEKHAGYTHASFRVPSAIEAKAALEAAGLRVSEGPVRLGDALIGVFVRDPDGNVVELSEVVAN